MKKEEKSFEENIKNLEAIVRELEQGNVPLDDAINKFNEAIAISKRCDDKLKSATESINKIMNENKELEDFKLDE